MLLGICTLSILVSFTTAFEHFQQDIPNGNSVVNPCDLDGVRGQPWPGVGHQQSSGRGARNPFGQDWAKNKQVRLYIHVDPYG